MNTIEPLCKAAAKLIEQSDGLLITAGAGMGVDSGLPDFRGDKGFWQAYPALGKRGLSFVEIANPAHFTSKPELGWGFYGHRLQLYRATIPHAGFSLLQTIAAKLGHGAFVFTSNVDGHFQKAGFAGEQVVECHGSIHHLQCIRGCGAPIWQADAFVPQIDHDNCLLTSKTPRCPSCGALARPNILMFNDWQWDDARTMQQVKRLEKWLAAVERPVVIEFGAGTAVSTVRGFGERCGCPLIRVNPTEPDVRRSNDIGIACGALEGIAGIAQALESAA